MNPKTTTTIHLKLVQTLCQLYNSTPTNIQAIAARSCLYAINNLSNPDLRENESVRITHRCVDQRCKKHRGKCEVRAEPADVGTAACQILKGVLGGHSCKVAILPVHTKAKSKLLF